MFLNNECHLFHFRSRDTAISNTVIKTKEMS